MKFIHGCILNLTIYEYIYIQTQYGNYIDMIDILTILTVVTI